MDLFNVEIKARYENHDWLKTYLDEHGARYVGKDLQEDTYFQVPNGRLKWRSGTVENSLIHYERPNQAKPKVSEVKLVRVNPDSALKEMLTKALGVKVRVFKERHIYFLDNVKVHLDTLEGLGSFVEIEAIDADGTLGDTFLRNQCEQMKEDFRIDDSMLMDTSYSDMVLENRKKE